MISTIIFDWGGVLALADNALAAKKLAKKYGINEKELAKGLANFERQFEASKNYRGYFSRVCETYGIPRKEIETALNAAHATHMLQVAKKLKRLGWPLYLLSDQMHFRTLYIKKHNDLSFFDRLFFSSEIGFVKPEKGAFLYVLKKIKRKPQQCLFIDNNVKNVKAAKKLGMNVILFESESQFKSELKRFGIKIA